MHLLLSLLPLVAAVCLVLPVLLSPVSQRANLLVTRVALPIFGFYVANESSRRSEQRRRLNAAHVSATHRVYASRTLLIAGVFGISGSIFGVYLGAGAFELLAISSETIRTMLPGALQFLSNLTSIQQLSVRDLFLTLLFSSATLGTILARGIYWLRWYYLVEVARTRSSEIEATLPRTVAFTFALSRSGMPFPKVLETLARNESIYGEAASEIGIVVRDMDAFGTDVITALQSMSTSTPSPSLEEFGENLASVLGSGRNLSAFLREQYERFQEQAEAQQQQYLELLSTFAEVYVTVLVAGPLFLITILVVIGLVLTDTLTIIRVIGYVAIPLASFGFVVYIDSLTESLRGAITVDKDAEMASASAHTQILSDASRPATDGGETPDRWQANRERLAAYDRFRWVRQWLDRPLDKLGRQPAMTLVVTVPLGLAWVAFQSSIPADPTILEAVNAVDQHVVEAFIVALLVISLFHEIRKRRIRAIERNMPDFLDRLASVNEAGLTVVESLRRVAASDLGPLSDEVKRTCRDIDWGADVQTALRRMDRRTTSPMISRSVTLITNAMSASGDLGPVLRIAANEAQDSRRLARERKQEMITYLLVIYISFFVFLGIIVALTVAFIPAVEQASTGAIGSGEVSGVSTGAFSGLREVKTVAYTVLFYHVTAIQGLCSGIIAGQLGEGQVADGVKHAALLLFFTYAVFLVI
ncbi:secretion system protein [Haloferax mediterranei ATCC 33500]|uniref:Archaeal flagella assembly protein J n=1 Tax=Haloferax mediterranei (strain ATCC 33500 / DSM 1411 / JCM 8866 / NBRC 14739 / NCIMB 2177 / R-4) TaxID=523841 RepID=I3R3D7_HALMT|nr:type II secretion system F family protein [Haloferax mediterranei]AFK18747.1 archaeal flagella assembly protein J [Haloferax mediterranei ATCC 33500]AHZ21885.1 secretion system protein [Haloferax mediterranei ATCC 33500]EMA03393.1 archaeal flagella assembly protein J [Haloferax mediterranei ATCC 33500]MDX5988843.1 type II secretion system F family protein [Haloferax mediterranei ATCC 33500]QCQ75244.1 secretion system protein [Haloferax mediterranei ATCC 33500]